VKNKINYPGDGIDGNVELPAEIIRLNNTVSRKKMGDPTSENEGIWLAEVMSNIFNDKPDGTVTVQYTKVTGGKPADWDTNYSDYYLDEDGDGNYEQVTVVTSAPEWDETKTYYKKEEVQVPIDPVSGWDEFLGRDITDWDENYSTYYTRSGEAPNYTYTPVAPAVPAKDDDGYYYKPKSTSSTTPSSNENSENPEENEDENQQNSENPNQNESEGGQS
jgi:hypothetical protein